MKIKRTALLTAIVLFMAAFLSLGDALADTTAVVKGGWLVLRASPSFSAEIRASYPTGTTVSITNQVGSWYAVVAPDGLTGYMYGDYLQIQSSGGGGGNIYSDTVAYVTSRNGLSVRLRSGPGKGYSILASYSPGTKCTVLSAGKNWSRIQIGKYTGYMMTEFLTTDSSSTPKPQPDYSGDMVYVTSRNGQGVNLRSGPSKDYPSIGFYSVGTSATMITRGNTWSYIQVGNRYGYMMTQFLTSSRQDNQIIPSGSSYVTSANGKSVNLRVLPSTNSGVLKSFPVGTHLTIITRGTSWYFVQIGDYYGYMMRQFIYDAGGITDPDLTFNYSIDYGIHPYSYGTMATSTDL